MRKLFLALPFLLSTSFAQADDVPNHCDQSPDMALGGVTIVYFDTGSAKISDEGKHWLAVRADTLRGNPDIYICVIGQADKQGDEDSNIKLSKKRAQAVADYLAGEGLKSSQMLTGWRGEAFGDSTIGGLLGGAEENGTESDRRVEVYAVRWSS